MLDEDWYTKKTCRRHRCVYVRFDSCTNSGRFNAVSGSGDFPFVWCNYGVKYGGDESKGRKIRTKGFDCWKFDLFSWKMHKCFMACLQSCDKWPIVSYARADRSNFAECNYCAKDTRKNNPVKRTKNACMEGRIDRHNHYLSSIDKWWNSWYKDAKLNASFWKKSNVAITFFSK